MALFATSLQIFLLVGSFLGGSGDFDHGADAHDGSTADGVKILSFRALVAFFVGFGWAGVLGLQSGMSAAATAASAIGAGFVFMLLIFLTMRLLMSMRADGSLRYELAIGQRGQVYVTIPAARAGHGQVELMLQGRVITAQAVTDHTAPLQPQATVEVTGIVPPNTMIVRPVA